MLKETKVLIIGGGPAGLAAAVQLRRFQIPFFLLEKDSLGGLLKNANRVENCPGYPKGISGLRLVNLLRRQTGRFARSIVYREVMMLDYLHGRFMARCEDRILQSQFAVVATGTKPVRLEVLDENINIRSRVFYEVYPLRNLKGRSVAIIGAGDSAFDYALFLSSRNKVVILGRGEKLRCLPVLFKEASKKKNIKILMERRLKDVFREGKKLRVSFLHKGIVEHFNFDYIIPAVGRVPELSLLSTRVRNMLDELMAAHKIFLIGDVKSERRRQFAIATGNGIEAALSIQEQLEGKTTGNKMKL